MGEKSPRVENIFNRSQLLFLLSTVYIKLYLSYILFYKPRVVPNARPAPIVTTVVRKRSNCMVAFESEEAVYMVCN